MREIVAEVRRAGAEPLLVVPPTVRPEENLALGVPENVPILSFCRPDEYLSLYQADTHYDPGHLNEKGATEFSRVIGEWFVRAVRKH